MTGYRGWIALLSIYFACIFTLTAQDIHFYRITSHPPSSEAAEIMEFRLDGMLVWSNPVQGVAGAIQVATTLADGGDWGYLLEFTEAEEIMSRHVVGNPIIPEGMLLIPGGTNSGTNPLASGESHSSAYPSTYNLTADSFYMDRYPVTKALWTEVYMWAINNGYSFTNTGSGKAMNHPVHKVSWYDALKWCNARSEMEGRPPVYTVNGAVYRTGQQSDVIQTSAAGYRLPTGVEWEYAARGGQTSQRFPWGDTIDHNTANFRANGNAHSYDTSPYATDTHHPAYNDGIEPYTSPVGAFPANRYGLYDMSGNVWEWIFDTSGTARPHRGGSWMSSANACRIPIRGFSAPHIANNTTGFRAVLSPE